jgi:RHH-type transcriptional regulator, proline utilization regulon repressor / proline dehydrogenase / delta 1-pyrroline-5-carboxylate dehydrogenase
MQDLQARIVQIGRQLLTRARKVEERKGRLAHGIDAFVGHLGDNEALRVGALRLIDVLPTLHEDRLLVQHLQQYFADTGLPLPAALRWSLNHADNLALPLAVAPAARRWVQWLGRRFIAGDSPEAAKAVIERLHRAGRQASLDLLGEDVHSEAEAAAYQQRYLKLIEQVGPQLKRAGTPLHLSLKASSLDSQLSPLAEAQGSERVRERLRPILRALRAHGGSLTLDMEHYDFKVATLRVFRDLLDEPEFIDCGACGIALQAYLRETEADLAALIHWAEARAAPIHVRLVRGAYRDTETVVARREGWPSPVWASKADTDRCYERCLQSLFDHHKTVRPVIASHNVRSLAVAMAGIEAMHLRHDAYEFQMLYGMADGLQTAVSEMGHPLRVYVPVGEIIPGMAYLVRRLLENSANTSFLHRAFAEQQPEEALLAPPPAEAATAPSSAVDAGFSREPLRRFTDSDERNAMHQAIDKVKSELGRHYPLRIGDRRVNTRRRLESFNPARPAELIGSTSAAGEAEAEHAIAAAAQAQQKWRQCPAGERAVLLGKAAELLAERRELFAAREILEAGKPWREADADVAEAIDFLRYYAAQAERLGGIGLDTAGEENRYVWRPRGVVAVIPPWNFPLAILTGMTAAAVAAGNAAIVKPSSETPVIAAHFVELLHEAGIPGDVVQFLPGAGAGLGEYLVRHPGVQVVAFTGSQAVGCRILQQANRDIEAQGYVKQVIAEMGGKNAIIVDATADLDEAVAGIIHSAFGYAGQKCSACSRVIAVGDVHDTLVRRLRDAADSLIAGAPERPETFLGPVISAAARARLEGAIAGARTQHKPELIRDLPEDDGGHYVGPAIFSGVSPGDELAQRELFGPVLAVLRAGDFHAALAIANQSRYALTGGVYSRTPAHLELAKREFDVGNLYLNRGITGAVVGRQPFGGHRLSGCGHKAGGPDYLLQFMQARTISENTMRRGFAPDAGSTE